GRLWGEARGWKRGPRTDEACHLWADDHVVVGKRARDAAARAVQGAGAAGASRGVFRAGRAVLRDASRPLGIARRGDSALSRMDRRAAAGAARAARRGRGDRDLILPGWNCGVGPGAEFGFAAARLLRPGHSGDSGTAACGAADRVRGGAAFARIRPGAELRGRRRAARAARKAGREARSATLR